MVQILFLMFLIGGTTQTSESTQTSKSGRSQSTSSADSGIGTSPVKGSFFTSPLPEFGSGHSGPQTSSIITGPLNLLTRLGYFPKNSENGVLRLTFNQPCNDSKTLRPVISSLEDKDLKNVTRIIIGPNVLSSLHKKEILEQLRRKNIIIDFQD